VNYAAMREWTRIRSAASRDLRGGYGFSRNGQPKVERVGFDTCLEEVDAKGSILDFLWLANELIQTLFPHDAVPLRIDIEAARRSWHLPVKRNAEANAPPCNRTSHYEIEIAAVKAERDGAVRPLERDRSVCNRPITIERPFVEAKLAGNRVFVRPLGDCASR
jgi:hypothetical protein